MFELILLIQLIATAAMTGIIWLVQIAIYPLFTRLTGSDFDENHTRYMQQVSYVIVPIMLIEAGSCALCLLLGNFVSQIIPTVLLAINWLSTALIQVPQHTKLTPKNAPALVRSNWIRTTAWTARLIFLATLAMNS